MLLKRAPSALKLTTPPGDPILDHTCDTWSDPIKTVYCIPGLGADERIFSRLKLERVVVKPVHWLPPEKGEPLGHYAGRLADQIDYSVPHYLLGVSFGGVLAAELDRLTYPKGVILVSSITKRSELPWYLRMGGRLRLQKVLPLSLSRTWPALVRYFNGIETGPEFDLLRAMARDLDHRLARWSMEKLMRWHTPRPPRNLIHIHGSADRILPIRYVKPDHRIEGGSHFMIVSRAEEIGRLVDAWVSSGP